jgi:hypothetical protein
MRRIIRDKLKLNAQTIRNLSQPELANVNGGGIHTRARTCTIIGCTTRTR